MSTGNLVAGSHTPTVNPAAAPDDSDANREVALALRRLTDRHPELEPLVRILGGSTDLNPEFLAAYHASPVPHARRSLVLRVLLEDHRLLGRPEFRGLTWPLRIRIARFLVDHPRRPLDPFASTFSEQDVPNHLLAAAGHVKMSGREFIGRAILQPLVIAPEERQRSPDLDRLYRASLLDEPAAHRLLHERVTTRITDAFFDTGAEAIELRNILCFARVLFQHDPEGGRLQSKIPVSVSRRLGLNRLSIPDLSCAADLIALRLAGVIGDLPAAARESSPDLAHVLDAYASQASYEDMADLARAHLQWHLADGPLADEILTTKRAGIKAGMFRTGFLFNLARLLRRAEAPWLFARFVPAYDAVNTAALRRVVLAHYRQVAGEAFADWLSGLFDQRPDDFAGIHVRDLSNILFYTLYHEEHGVAPAESLPTVAKFALGMPEPRHTGMGRLGFARNARGLAPPRQVGLPLLEACLAGGARPRLPRQKTYLLLPGWSGVLPDDGPVCLPRCLASAYASFPEGLRLVGPEKLPWGADPADLSLYPELAGRDVCRLTAS